MSTSIKIFNNPQFGEIRTAQTESGEPLFCLADVAAALKYSNPAKAVIDHCKGVTILETPTSGGIQKIKYGSEGSVYRLVMKSKLPEAEQFQDWVCEEVLPSIRKSGGYIATKEEDTPEIIMARGLMAAKDAIDRLNSEKKVLKSKNELLELICEENKPKVLFASAVETSDRSCLVGELAKILNQNGVNIGQNRLFEWLRDNHYLCGKGEFYNRPTQRSMDMGLFEIKQTSINKPDGTVLVSVTTKVSGKGQIYFVNKFLKNKVA